MAEEIKIITMSEPHSMEPTTPEERRMEEMITTRMTQDTVNQDIVNFMEDPRHHTIKQETVKRLYGAYEKRIGKEVSRI